MYCPSCRSNYIALLDPGNDSIPSKWKCRMCGKTWVINERGANKSTPILNNLMHETFGS